MAYVGRTGAGNLPNVRAMDVESLATMQSIIAVHYLAAAMPVPLMLQLQHTVQAGPESPNLSLFPLTNAVLRKMRLVKEAMRIVQAVQIVPPDDPPDDAPVEVVAVALPDAPAVDPIAVDEMEPWLALQPAVDPEANSIPLPADEAFVQGVLA